MSYSHYIRCLRMPQAQRDREPDAHRTSDVEGLANLSIQCPHCGFHKEYLEIPADEFESLSVSDDVAAEELKQ